jgi:hypothetical protein
MAKGKKHTPEQIVSLLRQIEVAVANGKTTPIACREGGITEQTYYRWRKEFGGLVSKIFEFLGSQSHCRQMDSFRNRGSLQARTIDQGFNCSLKQIWPKSGHVSHRYIQPPFWIAGEPLIVAVNEYACR